MTYRLARKRALEKAGFAHVSGWVPKEEADEINAKIKAAEKQVAASIKDKEAPRS